jgi:hypothetical protein
MGNVTAVNATDVTYTDDRTPQDLVPLLMCLLTFNVGAGMLWKMATYLNLKNVTITVLFTSLLSSWNNVVTRLLDLILINTVSSPDILKPLLISVRVLKYVSMHAWYGCNFTMLFIYSYVWWQERRQQKVKVKLVKIVAYVTCSLLVIWGACSLMVSPSMFRVGRSRVSNVASSRNLGVQSMFTFSIIVFSILVVLGTIVVLTLRGPKSHLALLRSYYWILLYSLIPLVFSLGNYFAVVAEDPNMVLVFIRLHEVRTIDGTVVAIILNRVLFSGTEFDEKKVFDLEEEEEEVEET